MMILRYAVILTHNRHDLLRECVRAIRSQVDTVIIIDNASRPCVTLELLKPVLNRDWRVLITNIPDQPPNLARFMNVGFDLIHRITLGDVWDVAMLCDDVIVPDGWFTAVATHLRVNGVVAGSTHQIRPVTEPLVKTIPDNDIANRMQGSAFIIAGEVGLRANEDMHWWWQDTDLDWQARAAGGMVIAPGAIAHNSRPNDFTASRPELAERIGVDAAAFTARWGWRPW